MRGRPFGPMLRTVLSALALLVGWAWLASLLLDLWTGVTGRWAVWRDLAVYLGPPLAWLAWRLRLSLRGLLGSGRQKALRHEAPALLTFALASVATFIVVSQSLSELERGAATRFNYQAQVLRDEIRTRLEQPSEVLMGLRSLYAANGDYTRLAFTRWVASHDIDERYPAAVGFGFIERVQRARLAAFIERERRDDAPQFSVRSSAGFDDLYVVKYVEPAVRNRAALGLDLSFDPVRREAVEAALRSGRLTLSGVVELVQAGDRRRGMLLLLPVHDAESRLATEAERAASTVGFVYSPLLIERVLSGLTAVADGSIDFDIVDPGRAGSRAVSYRDGNGDAGPLLARFGQGEPGDAGLRAVQDLHIGDRPLKLHVWATPAFDAAAGGRRTPLTLGMAGMALSALLSIVVWLVSTGRLRATLQAERMTAGMRAAIADAQAAQRENEGLLQTMNQHCIVSMADPDGRITFCNDAFVRISGYAREELIGRPHSVINSGTHPPSFWLDFWDTICAGKPWSGELCNRSKSGELYWVKSTVVPFLDAQGTIVRYVAVRTDVTHEYRIRAQLQLLNERFLLALDGGNDGLWDWVDTHHQEMWWSPQLYRLLGWLPDEVPSSLVAFDERLHPEDQRATHRALEAALSEGAPYDVQFRLRLKDGSYRWFRSRGKIFRDPSGLHRRMAGSLQDIHELKLTQAHLDLRNAQMAAVFSISPDAYLSIGNDDRIHFVSPAFERLTGLPASVADGQTLPGLMERLSHAGRLTGSAQGPLHFEPRLGPVRTLSLQLHHADSESLIRELLVLHDITEQLEVEQMKSDFLSTAAHELRTPMASIYGFTELLMTRHFSDERRQDYLGKIYRQSRAMMEILNELLDLARIEARRGKDFDLELTDLLELAREEAHDFRPPGERAPPQLLLPAQPAWVRADRSKLLQALRNLLSNAYKYSPEGGEVQVLLAAQGDHWLLQVVDHGMGMTPEQLARVTERFYRADASCNIPGTGLGMSIVKEIVELHGGSLSLHSEPGRGTRVSILLPRHEPPSAAPPPSLPAPAG